MRICETNYNFTIRLERECLICPDKYKKNEVYSLLDIVSKGLCPFAYFSIVPYWVALTQGAWFSWRKSRDDVVCQCPKPNGAVFLVKKSQINDAGIVEANVINVGDSCCPYKYSIGDNFEIGRGGFCPALFPSLWSQLDKLIDPVVKEINIQCCISPNTIKVIKR